MPVRFQSWNVDNINADDGSELDVMVLWTEFAECDNSGLAAGCTLTTTTFGNMVALVTLAVDETNTACKQSFNVKPPPLTHIYTHLHTFTHTRVH